MSTSNGGRPAFRIDAQAENVGRALGQIVVVILELLRELLERQAVHRVEGGHLTAEQIEQLGASLLAARDRIEALRESFGMTDRELNEAMAFAQRLTLRSADNIGTRHTEGDHR